LTLIEYIVTIFPVYGFRGGLVNKGMRIIASGFANAMKGAFTFLARLHNIQRTIVGTIRHQSSLSYRPVLGEPIDSNKEFQA
jgi:hypothetical protein